MPLFSSAFARRTITLLFLGVLALLAIVATAGWLSARTAEHTSEVIRERQIRMVTGNIQVAMLDAETGQRGYVLTGEERYLEPYKAAVPVARQGLAELAKLYLQEDRSLARLAELRAHVETKLSELAETIDLVKNGHSERARSVVLTDRGKATMDGIRRILDALINEAENQVSERLLALNRASELLTWVTGVGAVLIVLFAGGAAWTVIQYTRQLVTARQTL